MCMPLCHAHIHAPHHPDPLNLTNATVTGRTLRLHCAITAADTRPRFPQAAGVQAVTRPPSGLRWLPSVAEAAAAVASWAIAAASGRCKAAPAAADGPGASASVRGVRAVRRPPASVCRVAAEPLRLCRPRAPSPGCVRAAARGALWVPWAARSGQGRVGPCSPGTLGVVGWPLTRR